MSLENRLFFFGGGGGGVASSEVKQACSATETRWKIINKVVVNPLYTGDS